MTGFNADEGLAREHDRDLSPIPRELGIYAHIEGLVGEEDELLEQAEEARKEEHRERLHAITGSSIALGRRCAGAPNDAPSLAPDASRSSFWSDRAPTSIGFESQ